MTWWRDLDPDMQADARALASLVVGLGGSFRVTSVRRSLRQERGIAGEDAVSLHAAGRAFDAVILPPALIRTAVRFWRRRGGRWSAADPIHFER